MFFIVNGEKYYTFRAAQVAAKKLGLKYIKIADHFGRSKKILAGDAYLNPHELIKGAKTTEEKKKENKAWYEIRKEKMMDFYPTQEIEASCCEESQEHSE